MGCIDRRKKESDNDVVAMSDSGMNWHADSGSAAGAFWDLDPIK